MGILSKIRSFFYGSARFLGDVNALEKGKVFNRVRNRVVGRFIGKLLQKFLR